MIELDAAHPRLAGIVRPGDCVMWGQASAEPTALTLPLMAQRAEIGRFSAFIGISWSDAVQPAFADWVSFTSYCGGGNNRLLAQAGALDILPVHYSKFGDLIRSGELKVDVLMLQLSPPDAQGRYSMALACDYLAPAIATARVVIAEVNEQAPWTFGSHSLGREDIDYAVHTSRAPLVAPRARAHPAEGEMARHVAGLVQDGATLQVGIGTLPDAILAQLTDRRDLGLHTGAAGDGVVALARAGALTNARKGIDTGASIAGVLMGSRLLNDFARRNPALQLRSTDYIHSPQVLASVAQLVAINSAIEVDLTGQVNTEVVNGVYVGAVGGGIDFMRGAQASRGGQSVIVLPSRTDGSNVSRIVTKLAGPVSAARSDAAIIVTEHGIADLRGLSLARRIERMIAIAHPQDRDELARKAPNLR